MQLEETEGAILLKEKECSTDDLEGRHLCCLRAENPVYPHVSTSRSTLRVLTLHMHRPSVSQNVHQLFPTGRRAILCRCCAFQLEDP